MSGGKTEGRRLPLTCDALPLPHDGASDYSSSTLASRGPQTSHRIEFTVSSDSWSSESISLPTGSGSDTTDFTPCEFSDHPRLPSTSSSRPASGSSGGTLHATGPGGPYVARINVTASAESSTCCRRADTLVVPLDNDSDVAPERRRRNSHKVSLTLPKTSHKKHCSSISPADDCNIYLVKPDDVNFKCPTMRENLSSSTSPIRSHINHDGVVQFVASLEPLRDAKRKYSGSPSKHLPKHTSTTNSSCSFTSSKGDRMNRQHQMPSQITSCVVPASHDPDVSLKHPRRPKTEDRHRSVNSTTESEVCEQRKSRRDKQLTTDADNRIWTAPDGDRQTSSRSTIVGDSTTEGYGRAVGRKDGRELVSINDAGYHQSLTGTRHEVVPYRASTGDSITRDVAFRRPCGSRTSNTSKHFVDVTIRSSAVVHAKVPIQGFRRPKHKATSTVRPDTGTTICRTSELAEEEDKHRKADKLEKMKRFCLEQLALPSKSIPEMASRRRGKQQRKTTTRAPITQDSVHALKSGAGLLTASAAPQEYASLARRVDKRSLAPASEDRDNEGTSNIARATSLSHEHSSPREYASSRKHSSHSMTTRDCLSRQRITTTVANENSLAISITDNTELREHSAIYLRGNTQDSQTLDRRKSRKSCDTSEHRRNGMVRPSLAEDTLSSAKARTNHSSASGPINTFNQSGRLSITITSNEPEPEMQRTIDVGRSTFRSLEQERVKNLQRRNGQKTNVQLADGDVINRKFHEGEESSPSDDSDDDCNYRESSSSEATVSGSVCRGESEDEETMTRTRKHTRHPTGRNSTMSTSGQRCVDAAIQVEVKELQPRSRDAANCPSTPESDRALRVGCFRTIAADSYRTANGKSPDCGTSSTPESSSSKEHFRPSGKDVWKASRAIHKSGRKDSTDTQSESSRTTSQRSAEKKSSRRRHRHTVSSFESEFRQHLASNSSRNGRCKKTAEAVPAETYRTSEVNRKNGMAKISGEERYMICGKDGSKSTELCGLLPNGDLEDGHGCQKNLEEKTSTLLIQSSSSSLDSSLIDVVVHDGSKDPDSTTNRTPNNEDMETTEKQTAYEPTSSDRPEEIRQRGPDDIGADKTSVRTTTKTATEESKPRSQMAELAQNGDLSLNPEPLRAPDRSVTSAFDASQADVVEQPKKHPATARVIEPADKSAWADTGELPNHHRCNGLLRTQPTSKKPLEDFPTRSRQCGETSAVATIIMNFERRNLDMADTTSTDNKPNGDIPARCSNAVLQQERLPPERASFIGRLVNRLT